MPFTVVAPVSFSAARNPDVSPARTMSSSDDAVVTSVTLSPLKEAEIPATVELMRARTLVIVSFASTWTDVPFTVNEPATT